MPFFDSSSWDVNMLDHIGIKVSNLARSKEFYRAALRPLGYELWKDIPSAAGFGTAEGAGRNTDPGGDFWVIEGDPPLPRIHVAFNASTREQVDAFFAAARAAGGIDNGAPGLRPEYHPHYYAAFILDPDGYNIEVVCHLAQT
jgi:catechol 2,3-dioxygenase-like lactoylglutathione lyase family enzyme